jgi:membrane-bound inhibitor of C-type lysozyme
VRPERPVAFHCANGAILLATFYPDDDRMQLRVNDRDYDLPRLISASGARYGDERTIFWNKGREAMLQRADGPSYVGCLAAP